MQQKKNKLYSQNYAILWNGYMERREDVLEEYVLLESLLFIIFPILGRL